MHDGRLSEKRTAAPRSEKSAGGPARIAALASPDGRSDCLPACHVQPRLVALLAIGAHRLSP